MSGTGNPPMTGDQLGGATSAASKGDHHGAGTSTLQQESTPSKPGAQLEPGIMIKNRWRLVRKIGQGAFGEIYEGFDSDKQSSVAIKLEKWDNKKAVLKLEVPVLKKLQGSKYVCAFVHCGHFEDYNYVVMELLGENLSELRRKRSQACFSQATTARIGTHMLRAIETIHKLGYLHRDIKPSNFAMGLYPHRDRDCVMIDFGLTRKYRLPDGSIRPARDVAGFRGTARYASINSHLSKELGRRDDLWSLLYVLIEFMTGQLPWRKLKDKEEIGLHKIQCNSLDLVKELPPMFMHFMEHLQQLGYEDTPHYDMLAGLLEQLEAQSGETSHLYDWEIDARGRQSGPTLPQPSSECDDGERHEFSSERNNVGMQTGDSGGGTAATRHQLETSSTRGRGTPGSRYHDRFGSVDPHNAASEDGGIQMVSARRSGQSSPNPASMSSSQMQGLGMSPNVESKEPGFFPLVTTQPTNPRRGRHAKPDRAADDDTNDRKGCLSRCVIS